jgi:hypothetical protein
MIVREIASGTPSAVPDADPKLEVMSFLTIPLSVSTLGPLEPSAGKGPAVSSGTSAASCRARRRVMRVDRSKDRPRS